MKLHPGLKLGLALVPTVLAMGARSQTAQTEGANNRPVSCAQFMAPKIPVSGKPVGQEDCRMIDFGVVESAKNYHRIDVGISGTLSGYVVKDGRARIISPPSLISLTRNSATRSIRASTES